MKWILSIMCAMLLFAAVVPAQTVEEDKAPEFQQPILISSAGQSADVKLVAMLAKKQKLDASVAEMAQPADLKDVKTLIIVPGFSSKGLGAAGVSQKEEMERVVALVDAAKAAGIPIITVHIGGTARRGAQSDDFNKLAAESSARMIVVAQGDEDKFFTKIADEKKIDLQIVDKIAEAAAPLGALFTK